MSKDIRSMLRVGSGSASKVTKPTYNKSKVKLPEKTEDKITVPTSDVFAKRWSIHGSHLLSNLPPSSYLECHKSFKVAAFDLDGTLINTKSGSTFARGPNDWKWWTTEPGVKSIVPDQINHFNKQGYLLVIFTNQGAVIADRSKKSYVNFVQRLDSIVSDLRIKLDDTSIEVLVYASTKRPASGKPSSKELHEEYRKPGAGMWKELERLLKPYGQIDKEKSFYVGDAAGRPNDHSDSDLLFARAVGLDFKVPEGLFDPSEPELEG